MLGALVVALPAQAIAKGLPAGLQFLSAAPGNAEVVLRWGAPRNNGGSAILRYEVRHAEGTSVPGNTAWTRVGLARTHTVTDLTNGLVHSFEVRAVNGQGAGPTSEVQITPSGPPPAPQNLAAAPGDSQVVLRWAAPVSDGGSAILRYEVRHSAGASVPGNTAWTRVGLATTHTVTDLTNGALHTFEVRAVNGKTPGEGPAVQTQATPATAPAAPQGLTAAAGHSQVVLRWSAPANDGDSALVRYEVRHAAGASVPGNTAWTRVGLATTHTVTDLTNGAQYTFEVRAVNGRGEGLAVQTQATPSGPPAWPQGLTATAGDSQVVLRWSAPANDGGADLVRYEVRHARGLNVPGNTAWTRVGLATTHTITDLTNGALHSFEVRAVNGKTPGEGPAAIVGITPSGPPTAPQGLSAAPGNGEVVLRWSAPANDGGADPVRYEVRHARGLNVPGNTAWTRVGLARTHTVSSLTNGAQYTFEVRAVNGRGEGLAVQTQATPSGPPAAPQGLSAAPGNGEVALRWSAPANDGGADLVRYEVRHARGLNVPGNTAWTRVGLARTHTVSDLTNGALHTFEVRAVNGKTPGEGPAVQTQATPATVPAAPQNLTAAPDNSQVVLRWAAPANDGGSDLVRYEVRHAARASVPGNTAWTRVGLATTHTVTDLNNGALHTFEVRAVNGQGEGLAVQTQATPSGPPAAPRSLSATPYDGRVLLSWSAPADDGGFAIVRYEVRHAEGASVPANTVWTSVGLQKVAILWNLTNGALHSFEVRAVNGETSGEGPAAIVRTTPSGPPTAPQDLSAAPGDRKVALTWSAPANGGGSDLVRYEVRHAAHASELGASAWTSVGLATTRTISGLTSGVPRIFEVRAVNGKTPGKGPVAQVHATPTGPPTAPRGLSAVPGSGEVTLTWDSPFRNGGSEVVRYEMRHAEGASVPADTAWTSVKTARVYTVSGLTNSALHSFEVRAVNGKTPGEGPAAIVRATPSDVPSVPRSLSATPYDGRVLLSWSAPADDGGSAIVRYEVRHAAHASVPANTAWTPVGTATTHIASGLTNGALHSFEVRAVNGEAPSEGPAAIVRATPSGPPTAPQGLSAAPGDGEVALTWSAPANDGGSAIVRYEVRHAAHANELDASAWTSVGLATTRTISGLTSGVQRIFEVRAVNGKTPGKGPVAQVHATPTGPPTAPRGLSAVPGSGEVTLTWDSPFRNGGSEVVRYEMRHAEGASVPADTVWTSVKTARVYTVSGLTNGALHSFEVRAVNGKTPGEGPAAIVRATPSDVPSVPRSLSATPYDGRVLLSWSAPADDGGSAIVRYEVRHAAHASVPANTAWTPVGTATTHTVSGLTNGALHSFEVRAVNGETPGEGPATIVWTTPSGPPTAPQGLSAAPGDRKVALTWSAPANGGSAIVRYEVRHAAHASELGASAWTPVGLATTRTISGLTSGVQRIFEVRAVNGKTPGEGPAAQVHATPTGPPTAPRGLSAAPGSGEVTLTWDSPFRNGGSEVVRYEMRHAEGASVPADTAWTSVKTARVYTVSGLTNGALHSFEVRAVNGKTPGEGPAAIVRATPSGPPTAPQGLAAAPGDGKVTLTWSAPADDGGSAIVRYEVRRVPGHAAWTSVGLQKEIIWNLTNGALHSFEVRAVNGETPGEGPAAIVRATPSDVPSVPQNLAAAPGDGEVALTWSAPADDGGSAIVRYEMRHAEGASVPANTAWTSVETATTHTVSGLTSGVPHIFEVRAVNGETPGEGPAAQAKATPTGPPIAPRGLSAAPGNGEVALTWSAPAHDGGSAIVRYEVRHAAGAGVPDNTAWTPVGLATTRTVTDLTNGAQYSFEVRAVNGKTPGEGPAAQAKATPTGPPIAPRGLSAAPGNGEVALTWSAPAHDGGSAIVRYEVRHAEGAGVPDNTAWTPVGLVTTHTVTGLINIVQYSFEVRAVNGKTPGEGPAAQIHATPGGPPTAPQGLFAAPGDRKVTLTWSAPAYSGSSDLVRYEVRHAAHVSALAASAWTPVGLSTTHTVTGLTNGVPHFLDVRAVNGQSTGYVRRVRATPSTVPTAPRSLSATPYDGRVLLSWSAPADDGGFAIVRYEVRHAEGASVPANTVWTSVGLQKVAILWNLTNGALHSFEVRAVNGETSGEGPAAIVRTTPSGPPTAPQDLSAAPGDRKVALTWSAPANGGGSDLVRYEVRHAAHASELGASAWTSVGLATTRTISGLTSGVPRIFEVRAVNGKTPGEGPAAQVHATPTGPPTAPRGLSAVPGSGEVTLTWDSPFRNGGSEVVRYEMRHAEGASVPADTAWTSVKTARVYTVSGLTNSALHSFEVRAVNGKTPGEGPAAIVRATPSDVPSVPRSLSATPYDGRVLLSWSAPADDGGSAIVRYEVRHAAHASVPANTAWTPVGTATTHIASGLTNGALHSFEVRAVNGEAPSEGPAAIVRATPSGPPTAPQGLSAAPGDGEVALTWSAPANDGGSAIVRYEVRHAAHANELDASAWTSVGLATTRTISGLTSGVQRIFEVRAVNGKTSGEGPAAQVHATPTGPPTAPRGLSAVPGSGEVTLTWDSPFRNGGSEVVRYEMRHAEGASVPADTAWTSVKTARVYTVSGLTNGALHSFEVRAVNGKTPGEGPAAIVRATPSDVPSVPRSLSATPYDGRVLLSWSAPADDGGSAIVRYEVRHAAHASVPANTAWTSVGTATTHTVSGLTNGALHSFEVRAVNGETPGEGPAAIVWTTPSGPPTAPQDLSAAPGDGEVALTWSAPANDGGSDLVRYEVRHAAHASELGASAWTPVGLATTRTISGLTSGVQRIFEVRAVNGKTPGEGPAAQVHATPTGPPTAPRGLSAAPGDGEIALTWSAPVNDGGSAIVRYEVRHAEGASVPADTAWTSVKTARVYTVSGLTNGALHSFEVRAVNGKTPGEGPAAQIHATPGGPPTAPQGLSAAPGDGEVALTWSAPANDGGSAIVRYEVRHAAGASVPANTAWTSVGTATTHTVSGLTSGVPHIFEVRAVNGETPGEGPAAQAKATPTGPPIAPRGLSAAPGNSEVALTWSAPAHDGGSAIVRYEMRHAAGAGVPANTAWTSVKTARVYTVSDLTNGALHSFEVRAVNGKTPGKGPAAIVRATPSGPPTAPQGLSAAPGDGKVALTWSAPTDDGGSAIVRYEVRHAAGASVPANTAWTSVGTATTHTVSGLTSGALHSFEVRAVNGETPGEGPAAIVRATPSDVPSVPRSLSATPYDGRVLLSWSAPADDGGSAIVRYEVRHAAHASVPANTAWTSVGTATTHTASGLTNGALHSFEVRAVNGETPGEGPAAIVRATPSGPPTAPQDLSAAPGDRKVALTWSAPANGGGSAIVRYEVRHAAGASVPGNTAWTSVGLATSRTVTGLANDTLHTFEVRAVNGKGEGFAVQTQATPATVPEVTEVAVSSQPSSASTYGAGETISFTATFNGPVTVTGTPQFAFSMGGVTRQAAYASGSNSTELVFSYMVAAVDNDADGVSWSANALSLNGGTIKFMTSTPADAVDAALTHGAGTAQSGHKVKTAPVLTKRTVNGTALVLTYNEALDANSVPGSGAFTVKVGGTPVSLASSNPVAISGSTVTLTLAAAVTASDTVTVSYAVPSSNPIQDAADTDAAAFTDEAVTNGARNAVPVFADDTASRNFTETVGAAAVATAGNVGAVVTATDADNDTLTYSLEGTDAAKFGIVSTSGQIQTKAGEKYDREAKASYSVTVKASDGKGGADTIAVTITVENAVEKPATPGAPMVAATTGSTTSLAVSWTAPANTGRPAISGYKLQYRAGMSGDWMAHAHTGTGRTTTIGSLTADTSYQVQVRAVNADGDGDWSASSSGTTGTADACARPILTGREVVWTATLTVERYHRTYPEIGEETYGYGFLSSVGSLSDRDFRLGTEDYRVQGAFLFEGFDANEFGFLGYDPGTLLFSLDRALSSEERTDLKLHVCGDTFNLSDSERKDYGPDQFDYVWTSSGLDWSSVGQRTLRLSRTMSQQAAAGPSVSGVPAVTGPVADGAYAAGDRIEARVMFDALVVVDTAGGTPTLGLALGGVRREAAYASGSGTATLVFGLEVAAADAGAGAAHAIANGLVLHGATVRDAGGADAVLDYGEAPGVAAVAILPDADGDGRWSGGEAVEVAVTFAEPVGVDTAGGTPSIGLQPGAGTSKQAVWARGSGTSTLVFAYTLATTDAAFSSVLVPPDALALNGGTIRSTAGLDTTLAHSGAARAGVPRRALPVLSVADATASEGGTLGFRVTLAPAASAPVTVAYSTADGTATAGADYEAASGTLAFAAGETEKTVEVAVIADSESEDAETLTLALSSPSGATLGDAHAMGRVTEAVGAAALTASFSSVPPEHDGSTEFTLTLAFSEEPTGLSYQTVQESLFAVTGGQVTKARRLAPPSNRRFELTTEPSSHAAVTFALASLPACGETGSVCTADGRALTRPVSLTVPGPVALSVADASVEEGPGAMLAFAVTLDRVRHGAVTVDYATGDGTAVAGEDYSPANGTLTFAAGETAKTVEVAVLDDGHDEGAETLTLTLSNAQGARIADATATGTIENSDPMPKAWMVRFGRTVGSQVVDALTQRLDGAGGSHVTVAGINVMGEASLEPQSQDEDPFGLPEWAKNAGRGAEAQTITADDLLLRSTFHLSSGGDTTETGPAFTAWGRVATGGFEATVDDVSMDANVTTGLVGFDAEWEHHLAGIMLSQSEGDGAYWLDPELDDDAGTVESSLTGVYPYARIDLNAKVSAWALAGVGSGELTLHQIGKKAMPTGISMRMGAVGVKAQVLDATGASGLAMIVKSDAMWGSTKNERTNDMVASEGDVTRLRLIVEGERAFETGNGATFTPSGQVGLRFDGGDAETGTGLEVGAGTRYTVGAVTIEAEVRTLIAHETSGYEEWGLSGAIRVTPDASGRGSTLSIAPAWGRTGSASERLWSAQTPNAFGEDAESDAGSRLEMDAGYGFGLPGNRGVLTPNAGMTLGDAGARTMRTGARWQLGPDTVVDVEMTRQASDAGEAANEVKLRAALRF